MVIASVPSGGSVFGEMVKAYAEKNVDTTQEFARQLSQAKDSATNSSNSNGVYAGTSASI